MYLSLVGVMYLIPMYPYLCPPISHSPCRHRSKGPFALLFKPKLKSILLQFNWPLTPYLSCTRHKQVFCQHGIISWKSSASKMCRGTRKFKNVLIVCLLCVFTFLILQIIARGSEETFHLENIDSGQRSSIGNLNCLLPRVKIGFAKTHKTASR